MPNYEEMTQEVDRRVSAIDLNGKHIIEDCKEMIVFLKVKLDRLREYVQSSPFSNEAEEIIFFKYKKPILQGHLLYFRKILRIESQRPIDHEMLDGYYEKQQEEQKLFFDRHVAFFQYYRSGVTHLDSYYFLRGRQNSEVNVDVCHFDDDPAFSTGYDHLVARIVSMEMLYAFLSVKRNCLKQGVETLPQLLKINESYKWTGKIVDLVEIIYALDTQKCVGDGKVNIEELAAYIGQVFGVEIKNCFKSYSDIKRRKDENRTYFLKDLGDGLNKRMTQDDEKARHR